MDPIDYISLYYRSAAASSEHQYSNYIAHESTSNTASWYNNQTDCSTSPGNYTCSYDTNIVPSWSAYLAMVSSFASMVGSILIILSFILWRDLRTVARAILVFLALADLMTGIGYFFGGIVYLHYEANDHNDTAQTDAIFQRLCTAQSFLTTVFPISSFLWTANLAIYLFVAIVLRKVKLARKMILLFHIIAWGIPLAICIPAVATGILGSANSRSSVSWCWIKLNTTVGDYETYSKVLAKFYSFEFLCGKIWEILTCIISLVLCITVKVVLTTRKKQAVMTESIRYGYLSAEKKMHEAFLQLDQRLIWIPIVFIVLRFWGTLRFFISLDPSCHRFNCGWICIDEKCRSILYNEGLVAMQSICDPGQGWSNALLYVVFHHKIAQRLFPCVFVCGAKIETMFRKYCCLSCRHQSTPGKEATTVKDPLVLQSSSRSTSRNPSRRVSPLGYNSSDDGSYYASISGSHSEDDITPIRTITPETASINEYR